MIALRLTHSPSDQHTMNRKFFSAAIALLAANAERNDMQMAIPADVQVKSAALPQSEIEALRLSVNQLVASFRLLTAKLDLDAGVTDANWNALITDSAIATAPQKITLVG